MTSGPTIGVSLRKREFRFTAFCVGLIWSVGFGCKGAAGSADAAAGGDSSCISDTGGAGERCMTTPVKFRLNRSVGDTSAWCYRVVTTEDPVCVGNWLTISDPSGSEIRRTHYCGLPDCDTCSQRTCPIGCFVALTELKDTGATDSWDGTSFGFSTSVLTPQTCVNRTCVAPGRYRVVMCAYPNASPDAGQTGCLDGISSQAGQPPPGQVCVEVPFDLPASSEVTATLPASP